MAQLGPQKQMLLNQLRNTPGVSPEQLVKLLQQYSDLLVDDFRGIIDDSVLKNIADASRNPEERATWESISRASSPMPSDKIILQNLLSQVQSYIGRFPSSPKTREAQELSRVISDTITKAMEAERIAAERQREQNKWDTLNRDSYSALQSYKMQFPQSVHLDEIDDLMWNLTKAVPNFANFSRYISDMPNGKYAAQANTALKELNDWNEIKNLGDIFMVDDYRASHPDSPIMPDINATFYGLKEKVFEDMRENPADYDYNRLSKFFRSGIIKDWELFDKGLASEESLESLSEGTEDLPNLEQLQFENPEIQAPEDSTDIYFFGTPGTGKTCLLMGLTRANGMGYHLSMKGDGVNNGGDYAAALQQWALAGRTPRRTSGNYVTAISGVIHESKGKGKVVDHKINLIEMSGEEFALNISENKSVSFSDMGTGATRLLSNNNRKVFFIIIDCSKPYAKTTFERMITDSMTGETRTVVSERRISQLDIMNKFVSLFRFPSNEDIMKKVDAIHFIVTKSDILGDKSERDEKAAKLLNERYPGPISDLKDYLRRTYRMNSSTGFIPHVFTFSMGNFYVGDIYNFDQTDTKKIIDVISRVTFAKKEATWLDKLKDLLN